MRTPASSNAYGARGIPCIRSTPLFLNNYSALFYSQSSNPRESSKTHLGNLEKDPPAKVINVEDARKVFDEMLQMRPLPSVVRFNQILGQIAKSKHYSAAISLLTQMVRLEVTPDVYSLNILINCFVT